ncbi:MAG: hypothetical protein E7549_03210 [Ruminococcaceae bacterium]|nr:hypothetical protein [Oscillospiraceae bacterium]
MKKRMLALLMTAVLLCGAVPFGVSAAGQTMPLALDVPDITVHGRVVETVSSGLRFFWTNSGFTVKFEGTSLSAAVTTTETGTTKRGYLNVYVDGALVPTATVTIDKNNTEYVLAENLPHGVHTVEVRKRNEAVYGGSATISVKSVTTDGVFMEAPAAPARTIEFIGDSITSGFGNLVTDGSGDYTSATVEGTMTWAVIASKMLGADAQVLSRSGIGYCRDTSIHGTTDNSFYKYYTSTAALPGNTVSSKVWDFESHPADVVVIGLGANDGGGTYNGASVTDAFMTSEAVAFLELVREKRPNATIIWHYGLMGSPRAAALEEAVAQRREAGDDKVHFLLQRQFSATTEGTGTHGHPSVQADINRSEDLVRFIADVMDWEWDAAPMLAAQRWWSEQYNTPEQLATLTPGAAQTFSGALLAADGLLRADDADNETVIAAAHDLWLAYANRRLLSDMASDYIVVDNCDDTRGAQLGSTGKKGVDYTDYKEGTAALYASGTGDVYINHAGAYNVTLPAEANQWFFECWLYVDRPENIPPESNLEVSEEQDEVEVSWNLRGLGLQAGWNKLQLPLTALPASMTSIKGVRLFLMGVTEPITVKLDHMVVSKGRVAANTEALDAVLAEAKAQLAVKEHAALARAVEAAAGALSQADVDAAVARLTAALEDAKNHKHTYTNDCDADCNGCGELREPPHKWENAQDDFCEGCGEVRDVTLLGDVDDSGTVDSTDARLTLQYAVKKIDATKLDTAVADVNGDGKADSTDARLILQYAVRKIDKFPAE